MGLVLSGAVLVFRRLRQKVELAGAASFVAYHCLYRLLKLGRDAVSLPLLLLSLFRMIERHFSCGSFRLPLLMPSLFQHWDTAIFALSSFEIMYDWFYYPECLPKTYVKWITWMANMVPEMVQVLRMAHRGEIVYGKPTRVLKKYCRQHGLDPAIATFERKLPCNVVHPGWTCAGNAWHRWIRGFLQAFFLVYAPLQIASRAVMKGPRSFLDLKEWLLSIRGAVWSSAFLGTFISTFWATICILRKDFLLGKRADTTIGIATGAALCGFSILLDFKSRRKFFAMYVLPRALLSFVARYKISIVSEDTVKIAVYAFLGALVMHKRRLLHPRINQALEFLGAPSAEEKEDKYKSKSNSDNFISRNPQAARKP